MMPQLNPWWVAVFTIFTIGMWAGDGFYISPGLLFLAALGAMITGFTWSYVYDYIWACRNRDTQHVDID